MPGGSPVPSVKEHRAITEEIDSIYMDTIHAAAALSTFLASMGGGNRRERFLSFYENFYGLFTHTRYLTKMDEVDNDKYSLVKEIDGWFEDAKRPAYKKLPQEFINDGLKLFSKYQKKLFTNGVITVSR
jgi:hypothetical protein